MQYPDARLEKHAGVGSAVLAVPRITPARNANLNRSRQARSTDLNLHDTVRLSAEGLAKVLGDLEARVIRTMWAMGVAGSARAVHERVVEEHKVALLTVVTVLNKLVDKGILQREKRDGVFHYEARLTEEEFRAQVARRVVEGVLSFGPEAVTASFVDVLAEQDPERLAVLERLIRARMNPEGPDEG
ncbi:MAG TPA: BlaI/MecI/CopY family transcriptional regulator [Longimicrobiaceae bacterium]|nr:BlaI/MecI/CopY family transcriptional regulator [Longimicrobiaceae bacterium]